MTGVRERLTSPRVSRSVAAVCSLSNTARLARAGERACNSSRDQTTKWLMLRPAPRVVRSRAVS